MWRCSTDTRDGFAEPEHLQPAPSGFLQGHGAARRLPPVEARRRRPTIRESVGSRWRFRETRRLARSMEKKFSSDALPLAQLLDWAACGDLQLPDFQRGWVWDDDHIRSLLASISLSYPIGAVMTLVAGNPDVNFRARLIEGVTLAATPAPDLLLLDGQQRLTSLFQALKSRAPATASRWTASTTSSRWMQGSSTTWTCASRRSRSTTCWCRRRAHRCGW